MSEGTSKSAEENNIENKTTYYKDSFRSFVKKECRFELRATLAFTIITYALILLAYPFPNVYADTGAYISVAQTGKIGNYRPPGYSWFMAFSHWIHPNADVLVLLQTIIYFATTLWMYLSIKYFFGGNNRAIWKVFFFIFMLAPTCIYLCNFVISDSIFVSLTNVWITSLLWILWQRKPGMIALNFLVLVMLMFIRYIALFYPLVTIVCFFLAFFRVSKLKFFFFSGLQVLLFFLFIWFNTVQTEKTIGVAVLSGFSGWQKANNAMHVIPHIDLKPEEIEDPEIRAVHAFILAHNPVELFPRKDSVVVAYLWAKWGPLKQYMFSLQDSSKRPYQYFWHLASKPLGRWADYIIKKYPGVYLQHYLRPNFLFLFSMSNEALFIFPEVSKQMRDWFGCNGCEVTPRVNYFHDFLAATASKSFNLLWALFFITLPFLFFRTKMRFSPVEQKMLLVVSFFCISYILMSVYASPIVLRYLLVIRHSLILVPFIVFYKMILNRKSGVYA